MVTERVKQSREELRDHLREQVGFLLASIDRFHEGHVGEAKRMATHVRILVHDTRHSQSLFAQLGLKNRLLFYDTVDDLDDPHLAHALGLAGLELSDGPSGRRAVWIPALDPVDVRKKASRRPWRSWWRRLVMKDSTSTGFSRGEIVLAVANQDGGAHVDPQLQQRYADLSRLNTMRWMADLGRGPQPMPHVELMCIRHVAHELLVTLACQVKWSFPAEQTREQYVRNRLTSEGVTGRLLIAGSRPPFATLPKRQ